MVVVGLEPRKPTDKYKIRYNNNNNNMIVSDNAAVIAKRRRGFCLRGFFSCKMPFVCLVFLSFFMLSGSFNFTPVDVLHHTSDSLY